MWIVPFVTAALIALAIWLSRRRGRTAIAIGIGAAIAIFLTRVIIKRAAVYLTDQLKEGGGLHLAKDVVNASLEPLTTITIWICVIGVVAAVLVWLLGRRDVRAGVVAAGRRATGQAAEVKIPDSPVTSPGSATTSWPCAGAWSSSGSSSWRWWRHPGWASS